MKNTTVWVIFIVTAVKISKPHIYSKRMTQQDVRATFQMYRAKCIVFTV